MLPSRFYLGCCLVPPRSMPPGHLHAGTHNDCEALLQSIILLLPLFLLEAIIFEAAILEPPSLPLSLSPSLSLWQHLPLLRFVCVWVKINHFSVFVVDLCVYSMCSLSAYLPPSSHSPSLSVSIALSTCTLAAVDNEPNHFSWDKFPTRCHISSCETYVATHRAATAGFALSAKSSVEHSIPHPHPHLHYSLAHSPWNSPQRDSVPSTTSSLGALLESVINHWHD